jgi:hypothetical protein
LENWDSDKAWREMTEQDWGGALAKLVMAFGWEIVDVHISELASWVAA